MYRKFYFALLLFSGLFLMGCNKNTDDKLPQTGSVSDVDINKVMNLPYSQLTPDEQKVKLEQESIDFLNESNALKNLAAVETIQYFSDLLETSQPEIPEMIKEKGSVKSVKEVFDLTYAYGVYTWNASSKKWTRTDSSSELKFVFPAKKGTTSNNASLSFKVANSGVTFTEKWWDEDYVDGEWIEIEVETVYNLPKSVICTLNVDNRESAKIEFGAEYKDNKEIPVNAIYKMNTGEGYEFWWKVEKGTESKVSMKFSHKDKSLLEGMAKTGAKIDEIVDNESFGDNYNFLNKADAYLKLMDNLMIVYTVDIEKFAKELDVIDTWYDNKYYALPSYGTETYWTQREQLEKDYSDRMAKAFNDYMNASLVATRENYKIADLVWVSEKTGRTYQDWEWDCYCYIDRYDEYGGNLYLKFKDNTLIEASVYFGEGFNELENKWEDFVNAFDR